MKTLHIIFPVCLFKKNPHLDGKDIALVEEKVNFTYLNYHKLKIVLHRATMKKYFDTLKVKHKKYYEFDTDEIDIIKNYSCVEFIDPCDYLIVNKWQKLCKKEGIELTILPTLNFLIDPTEYTGPYYHDRSFYPFMRKKLDVLMVGDKPKGGQYSFDKENRKALPKNIKLPANPKKVNNSYVREAKKYTERHFSDNVGEIDEFIYPIDSKSATNWMKKFCEERLKHFGTYEDAMDDTSVMLYHSCLAVSLNTGLITDRDVLDYVSTQKVEINNLEGFIRQLIGWRNYVYTIYVKEGEKIRKMNFFEHKRKLSEKWWKGETGMPIVDMTIKKINRYAYAHHIERLMVLGNFMLICQINPQEVMDWFQGFVSIDAYDVFMVPNVLGMSQHADGGITMTRPYFSSSNYINKMYGKKVKSEINLKSGTYQWDEVWDAVYYSFINKHKDYLEKNYSTAQQVSHWKKKTNKKEILELAEEYLKWLN